MSSRCSLCALAASGCSDDAGEGANRRPAAERHQPAAAGPRSAPTARGHGRRRPVRLLRLGTFNQPTYLTAPRGDTAALRGGARRPRSRGPGRTGPRQPFLDISGPGEHRRRERPAVDGLRARLRPLAALLRLLHGQAGLHHDRRLPALGRQPGPGAARLAAHRDARAAPRASITRAARSSSGPTATCTPPSATAAGAATPTATPRTSAACSARWCGSNRDREGATRSRPTTRSAAARARGRRSTPTGCATPTASPSTARTGALTIGDVGQDAVEEIDYAPGARATAPAARRLQLRLERVRGPQPLLPRHGARSPTAGDRSRPGRGLLLDHRRLRDPRPLAGPGLVRPLPLRRLLPADVRLARAAQGHRAQQATRLGCRSWSRSARTAAAGCTRCPSAARCTASAAAEPRPPPTWQATGPRPARPALLFEGVVPALLTPFDESGRVDTAALAAPPTGSSRRARPGWWAPAPWARPRASARPSAGW